MYTYDEEIDDRQCIDLVRIMLKRCAFIVNEVESTREYWRDLIVMEARLRRKALSIKRGAQPSDPIGTHHAIRFGVLLEQMSEVFARHGCNNTSRDLKRLSEDIIGARGPRPFSIDEWEQFILQEREERTQRLASGCSGHATGDGDATQLCHVTPLPAA